MHAGFPKFPKELNLLLERTDLASLVKPAPLSSPLAWLKERFNLSDPLERAKGRILANAIAGLVNTAIPALFLVKGEALFEKNFLFVNPDDEDNPWYYQGRFLIRTKKAGDDMNVWLRFCPEPDRLYQGGFFNRLAIVKAVALDEGEADAVERDPDKVDLVIRFKDSGAILNLVREGQADVVDMLLKNVVQLTGNVGHLFKLGAVAKGLESAVKPVAP